MSNGALKSPPVASAVLAALVLLADEVTRYARSAPGDSGEIAALGTCVPLEAMHCYRRVYGSPSMIARLGERRISLVELFGYRLATAAPSLGGGRTR